MLPSTIPAPRPATLATFVPPPAPPALALTEKELDGCPPSVRSLYLRPLPLAPLPATRAVVDFGYGLEGDG